MFNQTTKLWVKKRGCSTTVGLTVVEMSHFLIYYTTLFSLYRIMWKESTPPMLYYLHMPTNIMYVCEIACMCGWTETAITLCNSHIIFSTVCSLFCIRYIGGIYGNVYFNGITIWNACMHAVQLKRANEVSWNLMMRWRHRKRQTNLRIKTWEKNWGKNLKKEVHSTRKKNCWGGNKMLRKSNNSDNTSTVMIIITMESVGNFWDPWHCLAAVRMDEYLQAQTKNQGMRRRPLPPLLSPSISSCIN